LTEDDWNRTISISSVGITPRIKKLSKSQKDMLIISGEKSVSNFLK
jgi:NTE family protein